MKNWLNDHILIAIIFFTTWLIGATAVGMVLLKVYR